MNWYAIYTKPRWEKKVLSLLLQQNVEVYLPTRKVKKQYTDRKKIVEEIVLPSYLFIHIAENQIPEMKYVNGFVRFIYFDKKLAIIKNQEIETLKKILQQDGTIQIENLDRKIGDKVTLENHPFKGQIATVAKINKKYIELILDSLQIKLTLKTQ